MSSCLNFKRKKRHIYIYIIERERETEREVPLGRKKMKGRKLKLFFKSGKQFDLFPTH